MKPLKESSKTYFEELERRSKKSRVHKPYQLVGLELAEILKDRKHKSLYIKLAKKHAGDKLLALAKSIAEKNHIKNLGAYFMKVLTDSKNYKR